MASLDKRLFGGSVSRGFALTREDQPLVVLLTDCACMFRGDAVREPDPAAGVETEDVLEVGSLLDPVIQHFSKYGTFIAVDLGRAGIKELTNDFDTVFSRPLADLCLLFSK